MTDIADGLRCPLFPCMLEGDLLDLVNKQRADGADEIERLREALHKVLGIVGNFPVDRFEYNIIKEARTALGEKE